MTKQEMQMVTLPNGWTCTRLEEFTAIIQGQSPPSSTYNEEGKGLPFYQGKLEFGEIYPTPRKWCSVPKKLAEKGDVLISVRAPVGPTNINPEKSCIGRGLAAIRGLSGIEPLFILYQVRAFENILSGQGTGTTFNAITGDKLKGFNVPVPPLPEQHRIVTKIEELFTRLDDGVEELKKVQLQLKRYRQSVLKSAFDGSLTAKWREEHKAELEPASMLLERIKAERGQNSKYKELLPSKKLDLEELPEVWIWTNVGNLAESMKNGIYKPPQYYGAEGVACLRMYNIENGSIVWKDIKRMNLTPEEVRDYGLATDDILVNRVNSRELVGKAASIPSGLESCVFESKNIRLRIYQQYIVSKYVSYWMRISAQSYFNRNAQQTVGMASINQEQLGAMPIPLCGLPEQRKIVEEIERCFSVADETAIIIEQSLKQAERLRQSILKRAFEGKLVPQNPDDEPAEKLLERIKAEKMKINMNSKRGRAVNVR